MTRFLQEQGVDPASLWGVAYGEYHPAAGNETSEGKERNRRIEIILVARLTPPRLPAWAGCAVVPDGRIIPLRGRDREPLPGKGLRVRRETGRNDPCPCGSGRKYKKCCYEKERAESARARDESSAVAVAIAFLRANYPGEVEEAIDRGFLGGLEDEEYEALERLPPEARAELEHNLAEWLLADAVLEFEDEAVPAIDLVLDPDGPRLPASARSWLEASAARPLSLYRAESVDPGCGFTLRDLARPDELAVRVDDAELSRALRAGDTFGARLVAKDGGWTLSDAFYPMHPDVASDCLNEIFLEQERVGSERPAGEEGGPDPVAEAAGPVIIDYWLLELLGETREEERK